MGGEGEDKGRGYEGEGEAWATEMGGGGGARRGGRGGGDVRGRSGDTVVSVPSIGVVFIFICCFSSAMEAQTTPALELTLPLKAQVARTSSCLLNIFSTSTLKNVASSNASLSLPLLLTKSSSPLTTTHADSGGGVHKSPSS